MIKKTLYILLFILSGCIGKQDKASIENEHTTQLKNQEKENVLTDPRDFAISEAQIKEGFVKQLKVNSRDSIKIEYKLVKAISDTILIREEYDSNFNLTACTKFKIHENTYVQIESYTVEESGKSDYNNITKPLIISFDVKDSILISEFSFLHNETETYYQELLKRRIGIEKTIYQGDTIPCMRIELLVSLNQQTNPSFTNLLSPPEVNGYRLEANGLGVIYHSMNYDWGVETKELIEIYTLEEFEDMKVRK